MNTEHYNLNSRAARDQEHHDFVRNSGLPLGYFETRNDRWGDRVVLILLTVGFVVVFVGVRWFGW